MEGELLGANGAGIRIQLYKRLQVACTHAHAYMWAPELQGSL